MSIHNKIRMFIKSNLIFYKRDQSFSNTDDIFELGFVSSLFAVRLINFVEQEFDISIDHEDIALSNFRSVDSIAGLIRDYRARERHEIREKKEGQSIAK